MTIIATCFVPDGIVMAADSRLVARNGDDSLEVLTDNQIKVFWLDKLNIGVTFAGPFYYKEHSLSNILYNIQERIDKRFSLLLKSKSIYEQIIQYFGDFPFCIHISGYEENQPLGYVFYNEPHTQSFGVKMEKIHGFTIKFDGNVSVIAPFFRQAAPQFSFSGMPINDAIELTSTCIEFTTRMLKFTENIERNCGGPVDILIITRNEHRFFRHKLFDL